MDIKKKLRDVPSSSGIYIMKGNREKAIYVGKAKHLKKRLMSYFQNSPSLDARKSKMVKEIKDFDYVVTKNELEALVLEANFIKRIRPRYNIILRDDKNYPYLKLTIQEKWPRLEVVRKIVKDGALYFGPYVPAQSMWETLKFIRRHFPLRTCGYSLEKPLRPCVLHQMERCLAPCSESLQTKSDHERYLEIVKEVKLFLRGERKGLLECMEKTMQRLSDELRFEEAARLRDRLKAIERVWETQRVISPQLGDMDVIGLYREKQEAAVFMLFVRSGMVIGQKDFFLKRLDDIKDEELISYVIEQFYSKEMLLPPKILLPVTGKFTTQKKWLSKKRGSAVTMRHAKDKKESAVFKMATDNARYSFLTHKKTRDENDTLLLKKLLNLNVNPKRIEAFDVSNLAGSEAVGAVVVWEDGGLLKDDYRLFKIKTVEGIDDFAMIGEVMNRYFQNLLGEKRTQPQLILIDGGKGQLDAAAKAMKPFALSIELAAIAKAKEGLPDRIYLPGKKTALKLDPFLKSTHLLQRIRDEAHRFAIQYHKKLRARRVIESPLERIKGIGKARRLLLLRHFGSIDAMRKASTEEIASLKGINRKVAELVKTALGGSA
jgi:excinuclease ABC subunit C